MLNLNFDCFMSYIFIPRDFVGDMAWKPTKDTNRQLSNAAGVIKMIHGAANNTAWLIMAHAMEKIKVLPEYRFGVKKGFGKVIDAFKAYERRLKYQHSPRFFDLNEMPKSIRQKYGENVTNEDYYEYWCGLAGFAYDKTMPLYKCLAYKYYKILKERQPEYLAEAVQWAMVTQCALGVAIRLYEILISMVQESTGIPRNVVNSVFECFNMQPLLDEWNKAIAPLLPRNLKITQDEDRNIELTVSQICSIMNNPETSYNCHQRLIVDFADVYRNEEEREKAIAETRRIRDKYYKN